jgi:hypothetical protein
MHLGQNTAQTAREIKTDNEREKVSLEGVKKCRATKEEHRRRTIWRAVTGDFGVKGEKEEPPPRMGE